MTRAPRQNVAPGMSAANAPIVSVVINNLDDERFVGEAIESAWPRRTQAARVVVTTRSTNSLRSNPSGLRAVPDEPQWSEAVAIQKMSPLRRFVLEDVNVRMQVPAQVS
jgi:hypothetical protein